MFLYEVKCFLTKISKGRSGGTVSREPLVGQYKAVHTRL